MRSSQQIEARVNAVLEESGVRVAPVDPVTIAEQLGVQVRPEIAADHISGGLYHVDGGPIIGVNAGHHPNRQRFTIAHEIGHLVLHDHADFVDHGYAMEGSDEEHPRFLRSQLSREATDVKEMEANAFAASLLMPKAFVVKAVRDLPLPVRSEGVENLARMFKVSQQAMTFRLQNLKVPLDRGG